MNFLILFYANLLSSAILLGLILIIHFVHYKSFHFINENVFKDFHKFHTKNISFIVIPLMTIEAFTSIIICFYYFGILSLLNLFFVFLIWTVTFIYQVPTHNKLSLGKNTLEIDNLVNKNIYRVFLWLFKTLTILLIVL